MTDSSQDPTTSEEGVGTPNQTTSDQAPESVSQPSSADSTEESQSAQSAERRKVKIGSQRDDAPRIRMERRHFADASLAPPAPKPVAPAQQPAKPPQPAAPAPVEAKSAEAVAAPAPPADSPSANELAAPPAGEPAASETPVAEATPAVAQPPAAPQRQGKPIHVPKPGPVSVPRGSDIDDELQAEMEAYTAFLDSDVAKVGNPQDSSPSDPQTGEELEPETRRRGIVIRVHHEDVFFSLGARHEGVAPLKNFAKPPEPGEQLDVIVSRFNGDEGLYELHIPGAAADVSDWGDISDGAVVEARVTGSNTGGLECVVNNIRGFIPASQISVYRVENMAEYVDQKLLCVVTEVNPERKNLVLSHRAVLEREKEEARQGLLENLKVGEIRTGTVRSLRDFGAFVDIGGLDGLIHISKLSWDRVKHPSDVLTEGQQIQVKVDKIDAQTGKIGLSYRDTLEDPWNGIEHKYTSGMVCDGVVTRVAQFGAFVKLEPGVEGLVHISELAHHRVVNVGSYLKEGQPVQVKVVSVDPEAQRIGLSMKALVQIQEKSSGKEEEEDETPRELAVPKHTGPLKGGVNKPTGGEAFGLKW